jgi:lipid-A-disaccharide synthase
MKILISAIEPSANIHLKELLKYLPSDIQLSGIFDKRFGSPIEDLSSFAIMGFVEAIKKISFFLNLKKRMVDLAKDVDKVVLIDSSGFNLPLAKDIKAKYPTKEIIYYILPQAWAWKKGRIPKIERYCDKLCSILPFEPKLYSQQQKISYVGHPLLDEIKDFKTELSCTNKIVFMPGSRKMEITTLLPIYKEIAKNLKDKQNVLVIPKHFSLEYIQELYGDISEFKISYDSHKALAEAEFAFICSGTATLEAALIGTPMVLTYIAKPLDFFIGKMFVKLNYIGLSNIFFEKMGKSPLHKEFVQSEVTIENLLQEYYSMDKKEFLNNSKELRDYLQFGSSQNVANIIKG